MTKDEKNLLKILKESKLRGAASISCGHRMKEVQELVRLKLAEQYGFGYRITKKGMERK